MPLLLFSGVGRLPLAADTQAGKLTAKLRELHWVRMDFGQKLSLAVLRDVGPFFSIFLEEFVLKKIFAVLFALVFLLCSCGGGGDIPSGGITGFDDYNKELSEEELAAAMSGANNEIENRPDENICYVTISCKTALESGKLSETMLELLPEDGIILDSYEVRYEDGASAFDAIAAAAKENKIHMEYKGTKKLPYIEGAANLYEFDCGALSGWMYRVNGWFPSFGMGQYKIQRGDSVELIYTCDLGKDVGDNYIAG